MNNSKSKETHRKRVEWLVRNKKLWDGYSAMLNSTRIEVDLLKRMKEAGLFPKNKTILDVSFDRLILKARETMAKGK